MLQCNHCLHESSTIGKYLDHLKCHTSYKTFSCPFNDCITVSCQSIKGISHHLYRFHSEHQDEHHLNCSLLTCCIETCGITVTSSKKLVSHLRNHIDSGFVVDCPAANCSKTFSCKKNFSSHLSRCHYKSKSVIEEGIQNCVSSQISDITEQVPAYCAIENTETASSTAGVGCSTLVSQVEKNLSLFFLKLQSKFLCPNSTVTEIASGIGNVLQLNNQILKSTISNALNVTETFDLVHNLNNSAVAEIIKNLDNQYKRDKYFEEKFSYVHPTEVNYRNIRFSYISVSKTLSVVLSSETAFYQLLNPLNKAECSIISDFSHGLLYQKVSKNNTIYLLLYEDELEICNPIGSARKKHKLVSFYYSVCNLYPWERSKTDDINLALLAKADDFKKFPGEILRPLISELQQLEGTGIVINDKHFNVRLFAISGDNLGSNIIGGYQASFSLTSYFCRFCVDKPSDYFNNFNRYTIRTPSDYDAAVAEVATDQSVNVVRGIKSNSYFNELKYFHVSFPSLPPCAAHDLLEGIIKADISIYIQELVNQELITYEGLNHSISTFPFAFDDARVKPCTLTGGKLNGTASQVWCFIRFLPLLLQHILDASNEIFQCILKLHLLCLYVFAPALSLNQIALLNYAIEEYIYMRQLCFPNTPLKPKHHLLEHYAYLYKHFGPLVHVWTLRFESKHQYFKRIVRSSPNFKNITSLLAHKHQLLQSYTREMKGEYKEIQCTDVHHITIESLPASALSAIHSTFTNVTSLLCTNKIVIRNTIFEVGRVLLFRTSINGFHFGVIAFILLDKDNVHFVLEEMSCGTSFETGFVVLKNTNNYICYQPQKLSKFYPLIMYQFNGIKCVVMKYMPTDCINY